MNQKIKKIFSVLLAALMLIPILLTVACGGGNGALNESKPSLSARLITGWDSEDDFGYFGATEAFGITRLNTDKAYVKQGEGSMYVTVEGNYDLYNFPGKYNDMKPFIRLFTQDIMRDTDFSNAATFTMDVYNASDRAANIGLRFTTETGRGDYGATMAVVTESVPLVQGEWNSVVFEIDRERGAHQGFGYVRTLDIFFDNREENQTPAMLYLDNFCVQESDSPMLKGAVPPAVSSTIIADYEDSWFTATAFAYNSSAYPSMNSFYLPSTSRNRLPEYIKSGSASLKIERPSQRYQQSALQTMADVGLFGAEYLKNLDFSGQNAATTDIVLDVYNAYGYEMDFTLVLSSGDVDVSMLFILQPHAWNELRFPMNSQNTSGMGINFSNVVMLNARFYEHYGTNAVHYVDNIRFEGRG